MNRFATSTLPLWWFDAGSMGLSGNVGGADGPDWVRHSNLCKPGFWSVGFTGPGDWLRTNAVVDDFGTLVGVK